MFDRRMAESLGFKLEVDSGCTGCTGRFKVVSCRLDTSGNLELVNTDKP